MLKDLHNNGATAMGAGVLSEVVASRELLTAFIALKWLVMSVERSIVAFEMFLTAEATRAESANEGLRWIFSQGLLAAAAIDRSRCLALGIRAGSDSLTVI